MTLSTSPLGEVTSWPYNTQTGVRLNSLGAWATPSRIKISSPKTSGPSGDRPPRRPLWRRDTPAEGPCAREKRRAGPSYRAPAQAHEQTK